MSKHRGTFYAVLITFGYLWSGAEFASGQPFDAIVLLLFTTLIHIERMDYYNV